MVREDGVRFGVNRGDLLIEVINSGCTLFFMLPVHLPGVRTGLLTVFWLFVPISLTQQGALADGVDIGSHGRGATPGSLSGMNRYETSNPMARLTSKE